MHIPSWPEGPSLVPGQRWYSFTVHGGGKKSQTPFSQWIAQNQELPTRHYLIKTRHSLRAPYTFRKQRQPALHDQTSHWRKEWSFFHSSPQAYLKNRTFSNPSAQSSTSQVPTQKQREKQHTHSSPWQKHCSKHLSLIPFSRQRGSGHNTCISSSLSHGGAEQGHPQTMHWVLLVRSWVLFLVLLLACCGEYGYAMLKLPAIQFFSCQLGLFLWSLRKILPTSTLLVRMWQFTHTRKGHLCASPRIHEPYTWWKIPGIAYGLSMWAEQGLGIPMTDVGESFLCISRTVCLSQEWHHAIRTRANPAGKCISVSCRAALRDRQGWVCHVLLCWKVDKDEKILGGKRYYSSFFSHPRHHLPASKWWGMCCPWGDPSRTTWFQNCQL